MIQSLWYFIVSLTLCFIDSSLKWIRSTKGQARSYVENSSSEGRAARLSQPLVSIIKAKTESHKVVGQLNIAGNSGCAGPEAGCSATTMPLPSSSGTTVLFPCIARRLIVNNFID